MRQIAYLILVLLLSIAAPSIAAPLAQCTMSSGMTDDCCQDHSLAGCLAAQACHGCNAEAVPTSVDAHVLQATNLIYAVSVFQALHPLVNAPEPPPPQAVESISNP